MGIYNRDYYRDDARSWRQQWLGSGCKWLIVVAVVVYVLQLVTPEVAGVRLDDGMHAVVYSPVTSLLDLDVPKVLHGQVWRLLTYAFCHDASSPWHILFNMLFLYWFGVTLERMYGTREFVLFYLTSALASGLAFVGLELALGSARPAIGASGAVMAVLALYAVHFPREEVFLFGLVRVQIRFIVLFYLVIDLFPILRSIGGGQSSDNVAHAAHLGGLTFGYLYYRLGLRLTDLSEGMKRLRPGKLMRRSPAVRIYRPTAEDSPADLDEKVDVILEKIQAHGEQSLTEQERDVLRRASERYKGHHNR